MKLTLPATPRWNALPALAVLAMLLGLAAAPMPASAEIVTREVA